MNVVYTNTRTMSTQNGKKTVNRWRSSIIAERWRIHPPSAAARPVQGSAPEGSPGLEPFRHRAETVVMFGPVGRRKTERIHAGYGAVPELVDTANEEPTIGLDPLVGVLVQDRFVDPPAVASISALV